MRNRDPRGIPPGAASRSRATACSRRPRPTAMWARTSIWAPGRSGSSSGSRSARPGPVDSIRLGSVGAAERRCGPPLPASRPHRFTRFASAARSCRVRPSSRLAWAMSCAAESVPAPARRARTLSAIPSRSDARGPQAPLPYPRVSRDRVDGYSSRAREQGQHLPVPAVSGKGATPHPRPVDGRGVTPAIGDPELPGVVAWHMIGNGRYAPVASTLWPPRDPIGAAAPTVLQHLQSGLRLIVGYQRLCGRCALFD